MALLSNSPFAARTGRFDAGFARVAAELSPLPTPPDIAPLPIDPRLLPRPLPPAPSPETASTARAAGSWWIIIGAIVVGGIAIAFLLRRGAS